MLIPIEISITKTFILAICHSHNRAKQTSPLKCATKVAFFFEFLQFSDQIIIAYLYRISHKIDKYW